MTQQDVKGTGASIVKETTGYLTKYERSELLGIRALQISMGAPIMVPLKVKRGIHGRTLLLTDPLEIAAEELRQRKMPLQVGRSLHSGSVMEVWPLAELRLHPNDSLPINKQQN